MATIVFAGGNELDVDAEPNEIRDLVTESQRGGAVDVPAGWVELVTSDMRPVQVQVGLIAYVLP
jgi:hypothetical protein